MPWPAIFPTHLKRAERLIAQHAAGGEREACDTLWDEALALIIYADDVRATARRRREKMHGRTYAAMTSEARAILRAAVALDPDDDFNLRDDLRAVATCSNRAR